MYLSTETLAVANRAVRKTFEQTCVAWQVIPHWDTGDPAQVDVRSDNLKSPVYLPLVLQDQEFQVTLAAAQAPTPDALVANVIDNTALLAGLVDTLVFRTVRTKLPATSEVTLTGVTPQLILDKLIVARANVEKAGYRAPSCLVTTTLGIQYLSKLEGGYSVKPSLLDASNVNALHRVDDVLKLDANGQADPNDKAEALFFGRRQRIAPVAALDASPGEEPVDLAVSIPPSLEVRGETNNMLDLRIRVSLATRVKDVDGVTAILRP